MLKFSTSNLIKKSLLELWERSCFTQFKSVEYFKRKKLLLSSDTCDRTCFEDLQCAIFDKSKPNASPRRCFSFTRSTRSCKSTVTLRRQLNSITSFIDGSQIYGSDDALSSLLREHKNG